MARRASPSTEVPVDRQGRLVVPRHLRDALGEVPGVVRVRAVDGGLLLESTPSGTTTLGDDGLPLLIVGAEVTNDTVLAAIDDERNLR